MTANDIAINAQSTANNLVGTVASNPLLKRGFENVKEIDGPEVIKTVGLSGEGFIVGVDPWNEVGGSSTEVGGVEEVISWDRTVNYNNTFIEFFTLTHFKSDESSTDSWTGDGEVVFSDSYASEIISEPIFLDNKTVFKATISVKGNSTDDLMYYMSTNGTTDWEQCTTDVQHIFSTTGQDLRFKITNSSSGGAGWPTPWGTWGVAPDTKAATLTRKLKVKYEV